MEEVLDDPKLNTEEYLESKTIELIKLPISELEKLSTKGEEKRILQEEKELGEIRARHHVN